MEPTRWRPVVGWEDRYIVSDQGEVRTNARRGAGVAKGGYHPAKTLVQTVGGRAKNYKRVYLHVGKKRRNAYVHHLVAEAFLGPRPEGALILHANDDGFDNRAANLRYGDREENELDRHVAAVQAYSAEAPF